MTTIFIGTGHLKLETLAQAARGSVRFELAADVLARGHSAVRTELIDSLLSLLNADIIPCIPSRWSTGPRRWPPRAPCPCWRQAR